MHPLRKTLFLCAASAFLSLGPSSAFSEESASDILKATGITGGFVVHLGSGDGKLTAALRASDAFQVQGLGIPAAHCAGG